MLNISLPLRSARENGLSVSMMGLGCMGMSEFYGASDTAASKELLTYAIEKGIRFFDTADVYGYGHNEKLVGSVLRNHEERKNIVLATKGGIIRDAEDKSQRGIDTSPDYILGAIDHSLDRLGTHIDLYYLHRIEIEGTKIEETMAALAEAIKAGKIGSVGLSEASAATISKADTALRRFTEGQQGIAAVQSEYSLMTRHCESDGVDEICRRLGILFVAYSPICRGLLAAQNFDTSTLSENDFRTSLPRFTGENLKINLALVNTLAELAEDEGLTPAQIALAWVLSRGPHVVPIPGMRSKSRLDENIKAAHIALEPHVIACLEQAFTPHAPAGTRYSKVAMKAYGLKE